ncbi:MAG: hypothetical protein NTW07_00285, partial [candidate division Zixibacteria bacterium]|nr:hypothetical protein [candidate division Zixibacteria bacterium]
MKSGNYPFSVQRLFDLAMDGIVHFAFTRQADLGLGGMYVYIDFGWINLQEQGAYRVIAAREQIAIA